jgi:hypothetical protein
MPELRPRPLQHSEFLRWLSDLGKAFVAKRLRTEADSLRIYYWALTHGHAGMGRDMRVVWSPDVVREWMKTLGVPPWAGHYRVYPMDIPKCPGCTRSRMTMQVELSAGTLRRVKCKACREVWVEESRIRDER